MADVKEQLNQNEIGERRNARRAKYVDAVGQYFAGEVQKTNLAQQKRLEQIKKKIGSLRDRDLSSLLRKLTFDESQRLTSKDSIQEIELKLSEIAKDIEKITSASELNVAEREIKKIEALIARLEKGGNTPNILERIKGLRRNKVVYMISELYRADTKLVDDTNIRGKQIFLLSKIDGLLQGPPSITIDQLLQDRQIANELENNISDFLKEYYNARKEKVNPKELSPDTIAKIPEQKRQLQKEKERYRRSAQLHALFEKIQNVKIGDEKQTYSALDLQRFIKQLEAHYNDIITSKEEHLKEINTKIDLQKIHDLISQLKSIVDELKSYLTPISDTSQRKKILETGYQKIQSALKSRTEEPQPVQVGERKNIETVNEFLIETDYEAQIDSRIETSLKVDGTREFIRGFEEFSEAHMREYEQMRKIEREGTLQQKETMAKAFIKSRLMDEFADTEKVKLLYGTSYRRMWEKNSSPDITSSQYDEIKEKLRTEVNEMFGLDEPQLDDKSKGLKTKLEVIIEKHFENQVVAEKAAQDFDKTDDEKKKDYNNAIKADLVIAFQNSGRSNPDIDLKIDELFTPESDKLPAFELLPTPNGVAVVFEPGKLEILKEFIFGQNPEGTAPETLAFTLKNNKSFKAIVEREIGVDWKGELMFISSDSDEYTMMHETQHAINHRLTANDSAESANMIDPSIKKFNLAVEEIATRFSSGEVWRELAYPQDENTKKINLSLMGLGYITPDMNVDANKENMLALYKFVETAKEIIEKEVKTFTENSLNPMDENLYGDVISEILMHNIGEDGKFDINAANIELETRFKDLITTQTQAKTSLDEADIMGVTIEDPKEKKGVIEQFKWLNDNEGFTFDIVGMKDIRGRPNVANDYYMDKNIGIEKA
ncbi:hypothetical protein KBD45_06520, partial [Candidatus Dojkabacteria bacterium]|nr:hypothetical protein [Candidatus Dojkabacteria bacterium]